MVNFWLQWACLTSLLSSNRDGLTRNPGVDGTWCPRCLICLDWGHVCLILHLLGFKTTGHHPLAQSRTPFVQKTLASMVVLVQGPGSERLRALLWMIVKGLPRLDVSLLFPLRIERTIQPFIVWSSREDFSARAVSQHGTNAAEFFDVTTQTRHNSFLSRGSTWR